MLLYYRTQVISSSMVHRNPTADNSSSEIITHQQTKESQDNLIQPKKPSNPVLESPSRRGLHRELLFSHRWGLLPCEKSELQRVMEQRRLEHQDWEQALPPLTDLEQELHKRRQRLLAYELEEQRRTEHLKNMPEFVRVRDNLRRVQVLGS